MKKCKHGYQGDCCCNCIHQVKVMCHPKNKKRGIGKSTQLFGHACAVGMNLYVEVEEIWFKDDIHGSCELYNSREFRDRPFTEENTEDQKDLFNKDGF